MRGGGLNSEPVQMRSAARIGANPYRVYNDVGFRCVAMPQLALPDNYVEVGDKFEFVDDDDGENAEDPETPADLEMTILFGTANCPDEEGEIKVKLYLEATPPGWSFSLTVAGLPFTCGYNPDTGLLECFGSAPDGYSEMSSLDMVIHAEHPSGWVGDINYSVEVPADCPADTGEFAIGYETYCYLDTVPTAKFYYDGSVHGSVETVQDAGEFVLYSNWAEGVTKSRFTDETPGVVTTMTLCFQDGFCVDVPNITVPTCQAETEEFAIGYETYCFLDTVPTAVFYYDESIHGSVETVQDAGFPVLHLNFSDGVTKSLFRYGTQGWETTMTLCLQDGFCMDVPDITVPTCPAETGPLSLGYVHFCWNDELPAHYIYRDPTYPGAVTQVYENDILLGNDRCENDPEGNRGCIAQANPGDVITVKACVEDGSCSVFPNVTIPICPGGGEIVHGYDINFVCMIPQDDINVQIPAALIYYWPTDLMITSGSVGDTPLTCSEFGGGFLCTPVPGELGETAEIQFCLENGECYTDLITITMSCSPSPETPGTAWTFAGSGCHPWPDPNYVFFMFDTGYEWLTPTADVTYTATDGIRVFTCVTHPSVPGRVYCSGLKPTQAETMNVCILQPGQPSDCQGFPGYMGWVSGLTCPEPTPTDNPPPASCSGLDFTACSANPSCRWVAGPTGYVCMNK